MAQYTPAPAAPPAQNSNRIFLTCGIIFIGLACLGLLVVGGWAASQFLKQAQDSPLQLEVQAPDPTPVGKPFKIGMVITNPGSSAVQLSRISLPGALLAAADLSASSPAYSAFAPNSSEVVYQFDLPIAPGESTRVEFTLIARLPGDYSGKVNVSAGAVSAAGDLSVVITQPTPVVAQKATPAEPALAPTLPPAALGSVPYRAVVQILAEVTVDGQTTIGWSGSGSIISSDGLILTNAHVVLSDRYYEVKGLIVALTTAQDAPPKQLYRMKLLQADKSLDIAVGIIESNLDGTPVDPASLNLPTVPMGSSDDLNLGDALTIIGYPGIGGDTVTLTRGEVSGYTSEAPYGNRAFIKTSATISGGNSGGLASNASGELIGIPTQLGFGGEGQFVDCRVLADTNRDGAIDEQDSCVPTGGFINALRPIKLAQPLIEAARRGEINIVAAAKPEPKQAPQGKKILFEDDFSDSNSGWVEETDSDSGVGYVDGAYEISVFQPKYLTWSYLDPTYTDTIVSADIQVRSPTDEGDFGLVCRRVDAENFYALEISEDGYYTIYKYSAGEYTALVDWTAADAVPTGQPVRLTAACVGSTLSIAVNGTLLASVEDSSFSAGNVGVIAGTMDKVNLTVAFDNFSISKP